MLLKVGKKGALIAGAIGYREHLESSSGREQLPTVYGGDFMSATIHTSTSKRFCSGNTASTCNRARISSQQQGKWSHLSYHSYHVCAAGWLKPKCWWPGSVVRLEKPLVSETVDLVLSWLLCVSWWLKCYFVCSLFASLKSRVWVVCSMNSGLFTLPGVIFYFQWKEGPQSAPQLETAAEIL